MIQSSRPAGVSRREFCKPAPRCIKSGKDPAAKIEIGHRSASVCHLGNIAVRMNAKLQWDPETEQFVGNDDANAYLHREKRGPWQI